MFNMSTRYEEQFPFFLSSADSATQMLRKKFTSVVMSLPEKKTKITKQKLVPAAGSDLLPGGVARGIRDQMKL